MSEESITTPSESFTEIQIHSEMSEACGPKKPARLLLFGRRYYNLLGMRKREEVPSYRSSHRSVKYVETNCIRPGKLTRRCLRRNFEMRLSSLKLGIFRAQFAKAQVRANTENSHEAKRLYAKDLAWRIAERKKANRDEWVKRTEAGETLAPLTVQPLRAERRKETLKFRKDLKKHMKATSLESRMFAALGRPSLPDHSAKPTSK